MIWIPAFAPKMSSAPKLYGCRLVSLL